MNQILSFLRIILFTIIGVVFVFLCMGFFYVAIYLFAPNPYKTDKLMVENYINHKAEFNQLAEMLTSEKEPWQIYPDTNRCKKLEGQELITVESKNDSKCADYVRLFKLLGLRWNYSNPKRLHLQILSYGKLFERGTSKGYEFVDQLSIPPGVLVVNDETTVKSELPFPRYKHIEGNWYIFYE